MLLCNLKTHSDAVLVSGDHCMVLAALTSAEYTVVSDLHTA